MRLFTLNAVVAFLGAISVGFIWYGIKPVIQKTSVSFVFNPELWVTFNFTTGGSGIFYQKHSALSIPSKKAPVRGLKFLFNKLNEARRLHRG